MPPNQGELRYLTKLEVAKILQVTARTIDAWMAQGRLPYFRIARTIRFKLADIETHLVSNCRFAK